MSAVEVKECRACGRTGTQRFKKVGRGKKPFACNDPVACLKRQGKPVTTEARREKRAVAKANTKARTKKAAAPRARASTNGSTAKESVGAST